MVIFDNCDSLSNWAGSNATLTLDTLTKFEGTASIRASLDPLRFSAYASKSTPSPYWDWSLAPLIKVRLYPSHAFNGRIVIITAEGAGQWTEYYFNFAILTANTWNEVSFDLSTLISTAGLQFVRQLRIEVYHNNTAATLNFDLIELNSVIPQATLTISISIASSGSANPPEGTYNYDIGATPQVTFTPVITLAEAYQLIRWTLDGIDLGNTNPIVLPSLSEAKTYILVAVTEALPKYWLDVTSNVSGIPFTLRGAP